MFSDSMMLGGGRKAAFSIANSVRLDGTADYFTRTPSVEGNQKKWTFSVWVKPHYFASGGAYGLFSAWQDNSNRSDIRVEANRISVQHIVGGAPYGVTFNALLRDYTAHQHLLIVYDGDTPSNSLRVRAFLNGAELSQVSNTISFGTQLFISTSVLHVIGGIAYTGVGGNLISATISEGVYVDGITLDPSYFGETDPVTGSWRPKKPSDLVANLPVYTMINRSAGTIIGNMTSGAGLTGLFDGNLSEPNPSLPHYADDLGWGGKAWGAGNERTVAYAIAYGSSNYGFYDSGYSVTLSLQGSNDGGSGWTTLGTTTFDDDGTDKPRRVDATTLAPYERHRILIDVYSGAAKASEFQFYEQAGLTAYGTNGFHLDFADSADLGKDVSGNGNHWTPVSLGAADVVTDSPTNNFATWNPLWTASRIGLPNVMALAKGNLTVSGTTPCGAAGTAAVQAGKYAFKHASLAVCSVGWAALEGSTLRSINVYYNEYDGAIAKDSAPFQTGLTTGASVIEALLDLDNNEISFKRNGSDAGAPVSIPVGYTWVPVVFSASGSVNPSGTADFGQSGYLPPSGFKTLCTADLPTPSIKSPAKHFDVVTYTGTGAAQSITGLGFQPDLVWCKRRDNVESHGIYDSVRGPTKMLYSDLTNAEATEANGVVSFDAGGFTANGAMATNGNGGNYVAWCWKAGSAAVANTDGSITSEVSVNSTAGFSIVSYSGTSNAGSVGHGLIGTPALVFIKPRSGVTDHWSVWHQTLGSGNILYLDLTNAVNAWGAGQYLMTAVPDSSTLHLGTNPGTNQSGSDYIAYCWAEVEGFSKFGSYTGNGSSDGPFVHCGFRPRWVLVKVTDAANDWTLLDSGRSPENPVDEVIYANLSNPEVVNGSHKIDFLANGFKIRSTDSYATINGSGHSYIYAAFAEAPFGGTKTTPAKAR